jgi:endonuclease/exonuclease/phosphatase family metal-dependent hydrolase
VNSSILLTAWKQSNSLPIPLAVAWSQDVVISHLKVLTYNIHKGFNTGNQRFVLEDIRHVLELEHPDVVFLQEIHGETQRYKRKRRDVPDVPQFEYLADRLWPHYAYGKNAIYRKGHHGNAILSKYPFTFWENIDVSNNAYASRSILHGVISIPGCDKPLHTLCVHMGLLEAERKRQVETLVQRIESHIPHDEPLVIAGDFNDWKTTAEHQFEEALDLKELFVEMTGRHAKTFPVWMPVLPMDRIYYRGITPVSCTRHASGPWRTLSDHAALAGVYAL